MTPIPTGKCASCGYRKRINKDGNVYAHRTPHPAFADTDVECLGGGDEPVEGTVHYPAAEVVHVPVADVDYAAGWYERLYWPMVVTALVVSGAALGFAIGVGVEGGWHW